MTDRAPGYDPQNPPAAVLRMDAAENTYMNQGDGDSEERLHVILTAALDDPAVGAETRAALLGTPPPRCPDCGKDLAKEVVDAVTADLDAAGILTTTNGGQRILATALAIIRRYALPAPPVVDETELAARADALAARAMPLAGAEGAALRSMYRGGYMQGFLQGAAR